MGKEKGGFLTPKAIANRIKAKGLQKLRWYCQMCQKQCRDENGFKCHCMSESHQRQLLLASENPSDFMDFFSNEFLTDIMDLLQRRFGTKRVHNNIVYNEYIGNRHHVHMNSTKWETLTDFTKWLGREGYCKVDETPKGWFVQYIDRDPETIRRQLELDKKKKHDEDDEERAARFIEDQVRRGKHSKPEEESSLYTELKRDSEEPVTFSLKSLPSTSVGSVPGQKHILSTSALEAVGKKRKEILSGQSEANEKIKKKKTSALDEIMEMEETKKKAQRNDFWLYPGIVVKVTTNRLGEKYFKKKAVVKEVNDKYTAIIKMLNSGDKLRVDQIHVQTVIPVPGKKVLILNGGYLGCEAVLQSVDEKSFSAMLCIDSGPLKGRVVSGVAYEDFSKLL